MPLGRSAGWTETLDAVAAFDAGVPAQAAIVKRASSAVSDLITTLPLYAIDPEVPPV
jgi:hypothetical protein